MGNPRTSFSDLPHRVRELLEDAPLRLRAWRDQLRQNPALLWHSAPARIILWIALGVATYFAVAALIRTLTPGPLRGDTFETATPTALLRVACTHPACLHAATVERPRSFNDWPIRCDVCGRSAAYRARACPDCRRWFANPPGAPVQCPHCAARKQPPPATTEPRRQPDRNDDEDGWG